MIQDQGKIFLKLNLQKNSLKSQNCFQISQILKNFIICLLNSSEKFEIPWYQISPFNILSKEIRHKAYRINLIWYPPYLEDLFDFDDLKVLFIREKKKKYQINSENP